MSQGKMLRRFLSAAYVNSHPSSRASRHNKVDGRLFHYRRRLALYFLASTVPIQKRPAIALNRTLHKPRIGAKG
jgi:hypothetical protein